MSGEKKKKPTIDEIINRAVAATRLSCAREQKNAFKAAEKRLYAYPVLLAKLKDDGDALEELRKYGVKERSVGITRFMKSGVRLTREEIRDALILDLEAATARDRNEIKRIEKALEQIADDEYAEIIKYKYFEGKTDEEISELLHCDPSTVRRNKSRLLSRIAVFLYGSEAVT